MFVFFGLLLAVSTLGLGVYADIIHLSPEYVNVVENTSVTLTCSKENGHLVETRWTNSQIEGEAAALLYEGQCMKTRFLQSNNLFDGICNGDGTYSVLLKRVDRSQFGAIWQCKETIASISNQVTIKELVPVASVDIYPPTETYMKENHSQTVRCKPSACRPQPKIRWVLRNPVDRTEYNITENTTQTSSENEYGLLLSEALLHLLPNRSLNGWALICVAWNNNQSPAVISKDVFLSVSYPPQSAPKIHGFTHGEPHRIIESDNGEFSCSISGGNPLANLSWSCFDSESTTLKVVNRTVISNVTWMAVRSQNNCTCESYHIYNGKQAAYVNVDVLYPPSKPFFIINSTSVVDVVNIIQNNTLNILCKSVSNPAPNYTWNGPNNRIIKEQILRIKVTNINDEGRYSCIAENMMIRSDNSYKKANSASYINVKVLYPPLQLNCSFGKQKVHPIRGNSLNVIKGDSFSIYCDADGYPSPVFKWDNFTDGRFLNITAITSDAEMTCTATNWMNETVGESRQGVNSATFSISVLYPPSIPTIRISSGSANEVTGAVRINVIETDTIEFSCYSKSKPRPGYTWFMNKSKLADNRNVTLANISRMDAGNYTCRVNNTMIRTFGDSEAGTNSSSTFLNVLYPPDVGLLRNINLYEESTLNITCPIRRGNPLNTSVFWTRKNDNRRWNNKQLIILSVSRDDDAVYTCTVFNEMIPTFGSIIKKKGSGEFHLNVFFSAEVRNFSVLGKEYKVTILVNETAEVPLSCTTEANPASDITIRSPKHEQIASAFNTNTLLYTLRNVSYGNAGQYFCTGRNNYTNGVPSISKLILIVRCPPRPSSNSYSDRTVTTTLSADAVLQFTAHEFLDEQDKTVFTWFKANSSIDNNGSKFAISSYGLQSNLSIRNVTKQDLGQYRLRVTNSVGNYLHICKLQAKDKPDAPKDFNYIEDSITDSSVTVNWVPGFHGGYHQTFLLLYKRAKETDWLNKSIGDSGDRYMNYTLLGLFSKSEYQAQMFARNEEGDSAYTDRLQFSTKGQTSVSTEADNVNTSGIVAGTISSLVIIGIIVISVYLFRKRSKQKKPLKVYYDTQRNLAIVTNESSSTYETLKVSQREGDVYTQLPAIYEQLDDASRERNEYSEIESTKHDMSDYVNMRI